MESIYQCDLAYVQAAAFGAFARGAASEIVRQLRCSSTQIRRVMDVGCGAGPLAEALIQAGFDVTGVDTSVELWNSPARMLRLRTSSMRPPIISRVELTTRLLPLANL
jgi:2-polyprenyl-3-methyl-5-hydroxy-6-metoxy-1,4-benzoquinol methylase